MHILLQKDELIARIKAIWLHKKLLFTLSKSETVASLLENSRKDSINY